MMKLPVRLRGTYDVPFRGRAFRGAWDRHYNPRGRSLHSAWDELTPQGSVPCDPGGKGIARSGVGIEYPGGSVIVATLQIQTSGLRRRNVSKVLTALLLTTALGWSYASSFVWLVQQWNRDPNHSYGYFVIPIALAILWDRRFLLDDTRLAPRWWGVLPL